MRMLILAFGFWVCVAQAAAASELSDPNAPAPAVSRSEFSGYVSAEGRWFPHDPLFAGQEENNGSLAAQPEYYHQWKDGSALTFRPFARVDSADPQRTHWDIRELSYVYPRDWWYFRVGVGRVFWGATEFVHLVDVVNQTDLVEHIDGEDKLGQPLIQFSMTKGWGTLDIFMLPYFRERTFPGRHGRLRPSLVIDTDDPLYESRSKERDKDLVVRYSRQFGNCDFGIYYFKGTNRDPLLVPAQMLDPNDRGKPRLIPFYDRIDQVGTDVQWATGNWLWKLEALYRNGYLDPFFAATGGFEYLIFGAGKSQTDVGLLVEYAYDERGDDVETTSIFDNDIFFGLRLAPSDVAGSELLAGVMRDVAGDENLFIVEASRRFGSHWRLSLDAWIFSDIARDSRLAYLRRDDFLRLELAYHF